MFCHLSTDSCIHDPQHLQYQLQLILVFSMYRLTHHLRNLLHANLKIASADHDGKSTDAVF